MADQRVSPQSQGYVWDGSAWQPAASINRASQAPNDAVLQEVQAVGAGPGFDVKADPSNLGTALNSAITRTIDGADLVAVHVGTSTSGTIIFEMTFNDSTWVTASYCLKLGAGATPDTIVSGAVTPTSGDVYIIRVQGARQYRVRTASTLGATVALKLTQSLGVGIIKGHDVGPAPHTFGYTPVNKVVQTTTTQTGSDVWTPASGKTIVVTQFQIQAGGTTAGTVQVWFGANADTTYSRGTDRAIFDGEFAPSSTLKPGVVQTGFWQASAADHEVHLTTSAAINPLTVNLWGYEF